MENETKQPEIKDVIIIPGIGKVSAVGELNFKGLLETLLDCKYITG